jgi:hypothetical protein
MASIGEFGFNIVNGSILAPNMFRDIMALCQPQWISLYNYRRLVDHSKLHPVYVGGGYRGSTITIVSTMIRCSVRRNGCPIRHLIQLATKSRMCILSFQF